MISGAVTYNWNRQPFGARNTDCLYNVAKKMIRRYKVNIMRFSILQIQHAICHLFNSQIIAIWSEVYLRKRALCIVSPSLCVPLYLYLIEFPLKSLTSITLKFIAYFPEKLPSNPSILVVFYAFWFLSINHT